MVRIVISTDFTESRSAVGDSAVAADPLSPRDEESDRRYLVIEVRIAERLNAKHRSHLQSNKIYVGEHVWSG